MATSQEYIWQYRTITLAMLDGSLAERSCRIVRYCLDKIEHNFVVCMICVNLTQRCS